MQIYVLFGLPGAGKTLVGKIFQKHFGFYLYDGDQDLPDAMKTAILNQATITDNMRDKFFIKIIQKTKLLKQKYKKIAIAQTFIKEKYRKQFLDYFPETKFILIQSAVTIREIRLLQRKNYPLDIEYAEKMKNIFDKPQINYKIIKNNIDGEENIKLQLRALLNRS